MSDLRLIQKKIRARMNDIADELASGCAADYSQYKFLTGIISGLALAEREVLDLVEAQEKAG